MTYSEVCWEKKPELIFKDEVRPARFLWDLQFFQQQRAGARGWGGVRSVNKLIETLSS